MPTIASVKAHWVPEDMRATVYGIFRVPLNLIVVCILMLSFDSSTTFLICSVLLSFSLASAIMASRIIYEREVAGVYGANVGLGLGVGGGFAGGSGFAGAPCGVLFSPDGRRGPKESSPLVIGRKSPF